jgi:hypothetical protein
MSWTLESPEDEEVHVLQELGSAIKAADEANILMFCSVADTGHPLNLPFPARASDRIFRVGAAGLFGLTVRCTSLKRPNPASIRVFTHLQSLTRFQLRNHEVQRRPGRFVDGNVGLWTWVSHHPLSYSWGNREEAAVQLKTQFTNLQEFEVRIDPESMCKVMRDAVTICRLLSIRHLWTDALCIIQDGQS